jgi:hypothetical protein
VIGVKSEEEDGQSEQPSISMFASLRAIAATLFLLSLAANGWSGDKPALLAGPAN